MIWNKDELIAEFKNPGLEYYPVMMWFWNGKIEEKGITYQLEKMREQNIVQFFVHPANGMTIPYMSDRYLELIKFTVAEAKRLGMKYWIYDEFECPSGIVGGQLLEQYPQFRQKELYCHKEILNCAGRRAYINKQGQFLGAQRIRTKEGQYFVDDITEFCEIIIDGDFVNVQYQTHSLQKEEVLFFFAQFNEKTAGAALNNWGTTGTHGYLNTMDEFAVAKFIEMTHEKYKSAIGDEFGKTVQGVFTDEPNTMYRFEEEYPGPWDDKMLEVFEKDHGYSLSPYLYALFLEPLTAQENKVREDYRATVARRFEKAFLEQSATWCHDNQLLFTGHFAGEEYLKQQYMVGDMQIDVMYMDVPGVDSIYSAHAIENTNFNIAGKLISSAAKFKGAERVLCETYTGSGWDLRFPMMKRIANRLIVLGINMIQYMGAHYSLHGNRKFWAGPPHCYMNPLFKYYHLLNRYISGLSVLSAHTVSAARVLVFNPVKQMIQKYSILEEIHWRDRFLVQRIYEDTVNALIYEGIDFDLFSEEMSDEIVIKEGYVEAFGYTYDCIIFPDMYFVNRKTAVILQKLRECRVKTIFVHEIPQKIVDTKGKTNIRFRGATHEVFREEVLEEGKQFWLYPENWPVSLDTYRQMLRKLTGHVNLNMETEERVFITGRDGKDCKIFLICNDEDHNVKIRIDVLPDMKIYDAYTYEEKTYHAVDGRTMLNLESYQMIVIFCDCKGQRTDSGQMTKQEISLDERKTLCSELSGPYKFEVKEGNMVPLSWEMFHKVTGTWEKGTELTFPQMIRLMPSETYKLRASQIFMHIPEKVYLNIETHGLNRLKINGIEVETSINIINWSEWDCRVEVTELIKYGENLIEWEGMTESTYGTAKPPFAYFSGDFKLNVENAIIANDGYIELGGWEKFGYPRFSGIATYTTEVSIQDTFIKAELEIMCEDAMEVFINGKYVETLLWKPNIVDITCALKQGKNKIELIVTSTFSNICDGPGETGLLKPLMLHLYS